MAQRSHRVEQWVQALGFCFWLIVSSNFVGADWDCNGLGGGNWWLRATDVKHV